MKKIIFLVTLLVVIIPQQTFAVVNSINGATAGNQFLATTSATSTMHMRINRVGNNTHRFEWDGTVWTQNQGGTGASGFIAGSVPFIASGKFQEDNSNFYWNSSSSSLRIGNSSTTFARLTVVGTGTQPIFGLLTATQIPVFIVTSDGRVGIGTTTPIATLGISGDASISGEMKSGTLVVSSTTATSTFAHGVNISGGCYAVNGNCLSQGSSVPMYQTIADASTVVVDWASATTQSVTLGGNREIQFLNGQPGGRYSLVIRQDSTGGE